MPRPEITLRVDEDNRLYFVGIEGKATVTVLKDSGDNGDDWRKEISPGRGEQRKIDHDPADFMHRKSPFTGHERRFK